MTGLSPFFQQAALSIGIKVLPITEKLLIETKFERVTYSLLTTDSLHLGAMNRRTIKRRKVPLTHIVTYDSDFAVIPNLTVWGPTDVIP